MEKFPLEQTSWDIFLATETFIFYIQFLHSSIQYTTNNYPKHKLSGIQFLALIHCFFQTLLQTSCGTQPVSYPSSTFGSHPNKIYWSSHSIEVKNLWIFNVTPAQKHFTFYPRTQYDWINNGGHEMYEHHTPNCYNALPWADLPQLHCCYSDSSPYLWCLSKFQFPSYMMVKNWPLDVIL